MRCNESEYLPVIKARMKCKDADYIDVGFATIKPDIKCGDVVYEVECEDKVHYGLGQALAYRYGGFKSGLIVIIITPEKLEKLRDFLRWARDTFGIYVHIYLCIDDDCFVEGV